MKDLETYLPSVALVSGLINFFIKGTDVSVAALVVCALLWLTSKYVVTKNIKADIDLIVEKQGQANDQTAKEILEMKNDLSSIKTILKLKQFGR